jgi:hypothetical protein
MYLKSLAILNKASISLKKSSKIIEIFIKAHISKQKPPFYGNVFKKLRYVYEIFIFIKKMTFKSLLIFTKASHIETKASTSLKINLKIIKIVQNVAHQYKNLHFSGNNVKKPQFL